MPEIESRYPVIIPLEPHSGPNKLQAFVLILQYLYYVCYIVYENVIGNKPYFRIVNLNVTMSACVFSNLFKV